MNETQTSEALTLLTISGANQWFLEQNLDGISDAEALEPPRPQGNTLNWVVGHLVYWRRSMLEILGVPRVGPANGWEIYDGRSEDARAWSADDAFPLHALATAFSDAQAVIQEVLTGGDAEARLARAWEEETVGDRLLKLLVHESYHVGQTGLLRRLLGHDGAV